MRKLMAVLSLLVSTSVPAQHDTPFEYEFEALAPGVWAGVRPVSHRFPVMGNTTFVISDTGVVVYDGGGVPVMADQVIQKVQSITELPVTHVIISHWHGDHHFGIHRFLDEYPGAAVVAQRFTREAMNGSPIDYIDGYPDLVDRLVPAMQERLESGRHPDGNPLSAADRDEYQRRVEDAEAIDEQYQLVRITQPTLVFEERLVIHSGNTQIELMKLGHGNTEGDIVMWLPQSGVLATGDLVVHPSPYAFNVPPRPWAEALRRMNALPYTTLVPGHGAIQKDRQYVDLIIEAAESIAVQRDQLLASGLDAEAVEQALDFSAFEQRFTGGDPRLRRYYMSWFERPFRKAALKAVSGEPMVTIGPRAGS